MDQQKKETFALWVRNFTFGVEDSLVSTVGLLSGIAIAEVPRKTIFLTGIVLIFVEAFSMAVGSFLSESSAEEYEAQSETPQRLPFIGGIIMFFSYFISGFIPLFPYIILAAKPAFWVSIALSLASLFVLGVLSARFARINIFKAGLRMLLIGGVAIAVGIAIGILVGLY